MIKMSLKVCKNFYNREHYEKYILPVVAPLLYHKLPGLRQFTADTMLPTEGNPKSKSPMTFHQKALSRLEESNKRCIENDLILYRGYVSQNQITPVQYMEDCNIYKGTFGHAKTGVEIVCSKQNNIGEITNSTCGQSYEKLVSRIHILEALQTTKRSGFGGYENIVTLLAFMCPGNGINYYLIKTGSEAQCLSTYLKQKMLHEPPKHIHHCMRMQYAQDMVSAVMHCNHCGIILRNITADAFIICKEGKKKTVKLYNLELAKDDGENVIGIFISNSNKVCTYQITNKHSIG